MMWRLALACALCILAAPLRAETIPGGHYGEVRVSDPRGQLRGFVVLFSELSGWSASDNQAADLLAQHGMLVVGVDTPRYAAVLADMAGACQHLDGDVEAVSHQLQRERGSHTYFTPILVGTGTGGILAERVLASAPSNTIAGAVSIDPAAKLDPRFRVCPPDPTVLHDPGLPGFWSIGLTEDVPATISDLISRLQTVGAKVDVTRFPPSTGRDTMVLALVQPHLEAQAPDEEDVSDLPLVELRAKTASNMLAIVLSGDGGWRDLDQTIGHDLQGWGVSVVGFDSLRYFWSRKTPDQTAHDLARVILTYTKRWNAHSVALIGYSFGADVLPFAYNRLPPKARAKVRIISLLGFASSADFEIRVLGWLGLPPSSQALPERPEVAKIPANLVQCFYGEDETDTLCPELAKTGVTVIRTSGGHHFGGDYARLSHAILSDWRRRMMKDYAIADYRNSQVADHTAAMREGP